MTARAYKTQFVREKTKCLEYVVGNGKFAPNPDKLNSFENFTVCTLYKSVLASLRITGYCRRYLENYSQRAFHLTELTKKNKVYKFKMNSVELAAFNDL